jgi:Putative MetA-pathway of phenol degradation
MSLLQKRVSFAVIVAALASVFLAGVSSKADAGVIPYSVIGPHEYQLPVGKEIPKDGLNLLLSYNTYRDEGRAWDGDSNVRNLFLNINKFVHIFNIEGLDNCGFLWEGVLGFGSLQMKTNSSETGMIDGQTGLVAWWKPTKNWTNVLEYWLYLPIGSDNLSGHSWNNSLAYMTNYVYGNFTFDGDFGYKFMGDYKDGGVEIEQGNVFFANTVFAYKVMNQIEPFFKVDYQSTESGNYQTTGLSVPGQSELALGIGNQFKISDRANLAVWYEAGVTGRNTTKTNAGYCRFIWTF